MAEFTLGAFGQSTPPTSHSVIMRPEDCVG
jgi:hypothetical protein